MGEKTKYWVPGRRPDRRNRKKEKAEIRKQEQNEWSAIKRSARIINANFHKGDLLIGLDYSSAGMKRLEAYIEKSDFQLGLKCEDNPEAAYREQRWLAAERELKLCIRRVKRELGPLGGKLKVFAVTSDMDSDTGEQVRVHHHLIVPAFAKEQFIEKWKEIGSVDFEQLSAQKDYLPLAEYMMKQVRRVPDRKKYFVTRNMIRPVPVDRIAVSGAELRPPKGDVLLFRSAYRPGQAQYIRYALTSKEAPVSEGLDESPCPALSRRDDPKCENKPESGGRF